METKPMKTVFFLTAEFGTSEIPAVEAASKFLGLDERSAKRRASQQELPFPVYRGAESQKSPWFVNVEDLAEYLDERRREALRDWEAARQ